MVDPSSFILHPFPRRYPFCCTFPVLRPCQGQGLRTVGVTHHRVLWSPDFPLDGVPCGGAAQAPDSDRPADLWTVLDYTGRGGGRGPRPAFWTAAAPLRM